MTSAYDALLDEICMERGFCGDVVDGKPLHVYMFVPEQGRVSAEQFVEWVFQAEGMDPNGEAAIMHRAALRQAFIRHMGSEVVDAQRLK